MIIHELFAFVKKKNISTPASVRVGKVFLSSGVFIVPEIGH